MSQTYEALVEMLQPAEVFVVCAARVHRALREGVAPPQVCLCRIFRAAGIPAALDPFTIFLNHMNADPHRSFVAEDRCSCTVSDAELRLLQAISLWQYNPAAHAEHALGFVDAPSVRRLAAPAGHAFAMELASVGMIVRAPTAFRTLELVRWGGFPREGRSERTYVH